MRILTLSTCFPNERQPALGVFIRERMRHVAHHCDVTIAAPVPWFPLNRLLRRGRWTGIPRREAQDGLTVHHPRFFSVPGAFKSLDGVLYAMSLVPFVARLRRRFDFDLIDAHFAYPDGLAGVLLGQWFRRPTMITLRGSIVRLSRSPLHRPQIRRALEQASGIVAVSQSLKRVAVGLGLSPDRIRVIPNGVDVARFRPGERQQARHALGLPPNAKIILTVAGIYEEKGQHLVLETLPSLARRHPELLYVMVGTPRSPGHQRRLEARARRLGVLPMIRFAGTVPHEALPRWFHAADVFCLATATEGWANVLLESLGCGIPVVTTDVGGNREIIREDALGRLLPWNDVVALREGLLDALERAWDPGLLVAHAERHSWESTALAVVDEFKTIIATSTVAADQRAAAPSLPGRM